MTLSDCERGYPRLPPGCQTPGNPPPRANTPEKQGETYYGLVSAVFEASAEGLMVWDPEGRIELVNEAFIRISGYGRDEVTGRDIRILDAGCLRPGYFQEVIGMVQQGDHWRGDIVAQRKSGDTFIARMALSGIFDDQGRLSHFVANISDITEEKKQQEVTQHWADHDSVTGLPNRRLFFDRLTQALVDRSSKPESGNQLALFFVDLDDFKKINDYFGHQTGDEVLEVIAERLRNSLREGDTVARFGGDEFTILLKHLPNMHTAQEIAEKLLDVIQKPLVLGESFSGIGVGASIGMAMAPDHGEDAETLLVRADWAMYRSKRSGKSGCSFWEPTTASSA
ncbi:sensor domain-containing diguanylate cyclase [Thiohalorhabdus sp.]|uniref:sensor domain-containing diguanylate cyclase n=1 Tax=Thiohalorhabdus sp. TaxID=3094134 RepID=UPI002FC3DFC1